MSKIQKRSSEASGAEPCTEGVGKDTSHDRLSAGQRAYWCLLCEVTASPLSAETLNVSAWRPSSALCNFLFALLLEFSSAFHGFNEDLHAHSQILLPVLNPLPQVLVLQLPNILDIYSYLKFNMFRAKLIIICWFTFVHSFIRLLALATNEDKDLPDLKKLRVWS